MGIIDTESFRTAVCINGLPTPADLYICLVILSNLELQVKPCFVETQLASTQNATWDTVCIP